MDSRFRGIDVTFEGAEPVILSGAKDLCSFRHFRSTRTTTEILRSAQDDTVRL
jgi:hypothetical protein